MKYNLIILYCLINFCHPCYAIIHFYQQIDSILNFGVTKVKWVRKRGEGGVGFGGNFNYEMFVRIWSLVPDLYYDYKKYKIVLLVIGHDKIYCLYFVAIIVLLQNQKDQIQCDALGYLYQCYY